MIAYVTGYWILNKHKYDEEFYGRQFSRTLNIHGAPLYMFCNEESRKIVEPYCPAEATYYNMSISEFRSRHLPKITELELDKTHVPSRELGLIWLEKIYMIRDVKNKTDHEWLCWSDAANAYLRDHGPLHIDQSKCDKLDKTKFNFTVSQPQYRSKYNAVTGIHIIAGTSWIIHRDTVDNFVYLFEQYYSKLVNATGMKYYALSDQLIWTYIFEHHPELFNCLGIGYGSILTCVKNDTD